MVATEEERHEGKTVSHNYFIAFEVFAFIY